MFEKFTSGGSADFRQRYQGTYGFFHYEGKKTLVMLSEITTERTRPEVIFTDEAGAKYLLRADSKVEDCGFSFIPPKNAWVNCADGVPLLVSRVPARQYQRGICDRNTSIVNWEGEGYTVNFTNLTKLYDTKVGIKEAYQAFLKSRKNKRSAGLAISSQFCVSDTFKHIKCFNAVIGKCTFDEKTESFNITLNDPEMWLTEVTDAFHRAEIGANVK